MRAMNIVVTWFAAGIISACAGSTVPAGGASGNEAEADTSPRLNGRTALLVVAPSKFQDKELDGTRTELEAADVAVAIASTVTEEVTGMSGMSVTPATTIAEADAAAYDTVVFIGGSGTTVLLDDPDAHALARATLDAGKLLAAICMAPEILANAGLLTGKNATCWDGGLENLAAKGATVVDGPVVVDGNIITGNGPDAATAFGQAIVEYLSNH